MNNEWELKNLIIEMGRRMWIRGYVASNDGNISVKVNDNEILTTPHGVSKGFMTTDMIIRVDKTGKVISGNSKYHPSSELKMHLEAYKERPDVKSVIHAHPPYATSFAVAGIPLNKCVLPEALMVLGAVPLAKVRSPFNVGACGDAERTFENFGRHFDGESRSGDTWTRFIKCLP